MQTEEKSTTGVTPANEASSSKSASSSSDGDNSDAEEQQEASSSPAPAAAAAQWQAIWSPQYNAYYFFNAATQETTWVNPLQPEASSSSAAAAEQQETTPEAEVDKDAENTEAGSSTGPQLSAVAAKQAALQAAALAQGIDPLLAHLDPSLLQSTIPGSTGPSDLPTFTAKFNARTGQFAPASSRTPGHLSEFERAKRMSEFYFDVNKWEEDLAKRGGRLMGEEGEEGEEAGKKRKRPSKKDLERFKEQKRLKKIAKTAWLRT
ncbi:hypothetical protein BJ912DRAFT_855448 [Pholiota molesta]|nr:hypothetical protein BJ912DRAFT_855448 [Pholiota molesta]